VVSVQTVPASPAAKVFRADSLERNVVQVLQDDYKISEVRSAACPTNQPVVVGTSFNCSVEIGDRTKQVKVTVKTADGEYEVGAPQS
jgi:hypothetical protein